ncbi:MAG TPA: hypothetical protein VFZ70_05655 [Euzebyales bacterium]
MSVATRAWTPLAGRREAALLELPSVARMVDVLERRCREPSWIRTLVPALDRFATLTGVDDLEALAATAQANPGVAEAQLLALSRALDGQTDVAVAGLAMGPKVWFRLNGVDVAWRPLPARGTPQPIASGSTRDRLVLLGLIGTGLYLAELLRVRLGDLGVLDTDGDVIPDLEAEPLAVRFDQRRGRVAERVTFLSFAARQAVIDEVARRRREGMDVGPEAPLIATADGRPATRDAVTSARRRAHDLIRAGNRLNVDLCRTTGEFFRTWGMPGERFMQRAAASETEQ